MSDGGDGRRHSNPLSADLITDPQEKAERESRNALAQFDKGLEIVEYFLSDERPFRFRPSSILTLHREALGGISAYAGIYRPAGIEIQGSKHEPPPAYLVPELIEDMCDYVNENWQASTALNLAAYIMWRLNWIHPFADGNGRTSRIMSYVVLCIRLGYRLPGTKTIPDQITENRQPYFNALDAADAAALNNTFDVSQMEDILSAYLAAQLYQVAEDAGGNAVFDRESPQAPV